jgi:two-component system cell cycle sensor histidine kinase PleC
MALLFSAKSQAAWFRTFSASILVGGLWAFRRLAAKPEAAHALLAEAIDCVDEGFIAFDYKERLIFVNQKYLDYHAEITEHVVQGKTKEELLRLWVRRTQCPASDDQAEK